MAEPMKEDSQHPVPEASQKPPSSPGVEAIWEALTEPVQPLSLGVEEPQEERKGREVLILVLHGRRFGLPVGNLLEILYVPRLTRVPRAPRALKGVCSIRGQVLPVLDLGLCLGDAPASGNPGRIVALNLEGAPVGLLVDQVERVVRLSPEAVHPVPGTLPEGRDFPGLGVAQVDEHLIPLLDVKALVDRACPMGEGKRQEGGL